MSFSKEEINEFKTEAFELLDMAEKSLLGLDQGAEFQSAFDAVFRGFHNLKGAAGMMELQKLQSHTHELENILMGLKDGSSIPKEYISLFLRGIDAARNLLNGEDVTFDFNVGLPAQEKSPLHPTNTEVSIPLESGINNKDSKVSQEIPDSTLNEFVSEAEEIVERISNCLQLIEKGNITKDCVDALYRDVHSLKGSSYLFSFTKLGDISHGMESSLEKVRNGTHLPSKELINTLFKCIAIIESLIKKIKTKAPDDDLGEAVLSMVRSLTSNSEQLEQNSNLKEAKPHPVVEIEVSVTPPNSSSHMNTTESVLQQSTPKDKDRETEGASSIRVPVSLLDSLMTLMGEMVLVRNQVLQFSNKSDDLEFLSMSKRLNVVTSEIQGEMMKTRMQPIGNVLGKFNRVVRDLSQELKKSIGRVPSLVEIPELTPRSFIFYPTIS